MNESGEPFDAFDEVETGEAFTLQNRRLLKVELSEGAVFAKNGSMVAYQGDVHFEHKGGGLGRLLKKAATGESLRLMEATGSGELFLANQAMLVHVLRLTNDALTVNGANILAFEAGIDWDVSVISVGGAGTPSFWEPTRTLPPDSFRNRPKNVWLASSTTTNSRRRLAPRASPSSRSMPR
mgnify:CR=1 FL=1